MTNYLEEENDRLRRELQAVYERQRSEMEEQRKERKQEAINAMCEAENWEEAFSKGLDRYREEAADEVALNEKIGDAGDPYYQPDMFFSEMVPKIERAQEIYNLRMLNAQVAIARILEEARDNIADAIEREYPGDNSMEEFAQAMRDDNHEWLVDW